MATKVSAHRKAEYARYKAEGHFAKNKKAKLIRALKLAPDSMEIQNALKNIGATPDRHTPKAAAWSHTEKHYARMFKKFARPSTKIVVKMPEWKLDRLSTRATDGAGNLVWST